MPSPDDVYIKCDELDNIPPQNRDNWLDEIRLLVEKLPQNATVLQVGCMDGTRIRAILKERPDLKITGVDIEQAMVDRCRKNSNELGLTAQFIQGDITKPLPVSNFDYVICLNNTLGYIPDQQKAIENMKKIGGKVILSVYGEKFTDELALQYFACINLQIVKIEKNVFHTREFVNIKRYSLEDVKKWSTNIIATPIGYFCIIDGLNN